MTVQAISHSHTDWRTGEATRAAALAEIDTHLDNLKACVRWLLAQGVSVNSADMCRGRHLPHITVAYSPLLHHLFGDDCASIKRRQEGEVTIFTWAAKRYECAIRWEETAR